MTTRIAIDDFLSQRVLAVVGVSRQARKFGNVVFKELTGKGYKVFAVNPRMETVNGQPCYPSLSSLPEAVGGAVVVVPPGQTERVVQDAGTAGISRIWMQQGSESPQAIHFCRENGMSVVHGECILMYAEPTAFFHRLHRGLWRLFGKSPR